ncbi:MAG TPA: TlpA disulfide reductase family protein, partial [bacterium]|nr:TlpA disulfide reductase family protein [bacterium]
SKQNDQELYRTAMLSKDAHERARLLEILLARQDDAEAKEFVSRQLVQAYAELGETEKMEAAASALTLEDDYPSAQVKNAMAYAWAEKGIKLDAARSNIMSALNTLDRMESDKRGLPPQLLEDESQLSAFVEENRGYFLDTLGWIAHKEGKDKESLAVLEEASRRTPHGTVAFHLGEVNRALGNFDAAGKAYASAAVEDDEEAAKAKTALEDLGKQGKVDSTALFADAKKKHDDRVAREKAEQAAEEKRRNEEIAAIAAHQRESARKGALDYRLDAAVPDFAIADFAGKKLASADLEHHVTIIDFWASWCGPCKVEMPHVQALYEKYHEKVRFLAISEDETKDDATDFIKDTKYSFPVAFDDGAVGRSFQITGLPTLLVISPCGKIAWMHRGFNPNIDAILTEQIDKLLSETTQKCEASK